LNPAADAGIALALLQVGDAYHKGEGTDVNLEQAVHNYRSATERGLRIGQFNLGVAYLNGEGVAQNLKGAVFCFKKAADAGLAEAQYGIGLCCLLGRGVEAMEEVGRRWLELAANQGYKLAQVAMGLLLLEGRERIRPSPHDAFNWFQRASSGGNLLATIYLGYCFLHGLGTDEDEKKAREVIARARSEVEARTARGELQGQDGILLTEAVDMIGKVEALLTAPEN